MQKESDIPTIISHPIIIITVPVFNEEKYIKDTLDSIASQTWQEFKVLISDNASTDETGSICRRYCELDDRFFYVYQSQNIGAVANFQYLLDHTDSPYFMWIGGHDLIHPDFLTIHLSKMNCNSKLCLSYSATQWIDQNGRPTRLTDGGQLANIMGPAWLRYLKSIYPLSEYTCINQLIRRSALQNIKIEKVYACDQIILSHVLYFGVSSCESRALYLAREFLHTRAETEMERVTGKKQAKVDLALYEKAYFKDFNVLFSGSPLKFLLFMLLFFCLKTRLIWHIFKYQVFPKIKHARKL